MTDILQKSLLTVIKYFTYYFPILKTTLLLNKMITIAKGKLLKRKKAVEFGAENIDNTAPVKKILDDLQHKNNQAFTFYCQTVRPRPAVKEDYNFHFTLTGHPIFAFREDWEGDLSSVYFERFSYKSLMPRMITTLKNIQNSDPVTECIKKKNVWHRDCKDLRHTAVIKSVLDRYENLNEMVVQCPKFLVDIAAHLDSDPDPYFDDSYNWYYSGNGNIQLICIDWVDYLLHSEFSTLYLTLFTRNDLYLETSHSATFECEGNIILETICSSLNIVALRTKWKVYILKIISIDGKIEFQKIKSMEAESFTSISFDDHHKNILYITTLHNKVSIVNLDRLTALTVNLKTKANSLINNWNAVISSDRVTYTHVSKSCLSIYDKRTNSASCTWNGIRELTDHLGCNDITVAKQYKDRSIYYATDHHLFLLDIRYEKRYKPNAVLRWTHGMQCEPTYLSLCDFDYNKELICLSSQWCEDTCVVPNYNTSLFKESEVTGVTVPYRPPSILTTLSEAKEKLLCVDINNSIDTRLATSITGHVIMEHGQNYVILMQNSLGDISCHVLYPEHLESFMDDDSIQHLQDWSKAYEKENKLFEVSSITNISDTWKHLKSVPEGYIFCESELNKVNSKTIRKEITNVIKNEELDAGLLDVWTEDTNKSSVIERSSLDILHYSDDESLLGASE